MSEKYWEIKWEDGQTDIWSADISRTEIIKMVADIAEGESFTVELKEEE